MRGKTKGKCSRCKVIYRWLRSFGRVARATCPRCGCALESTPWGLARIIEEGFQLVERRPVIEEEAATNQASHKENGGNDGS